MARTNHIPQRSRQANRDMIDLTAYYGAALDEDWLGKPGANLASLPSGVQAFALAAFDVRGLIQLACERTRAETGIDFVQSVEGIPIHYLGRKLHFLHGTAWSAEPDAEIGAYVLHYADGQTARLPIVYGRQVRDWWVREGDPIPTDAEIAWRGENEAAHKSGCRVQLYRYTANNPWPGKEIATIDFCSAMTKSAPFLIGLTVEPPEHTYEGFKAVTIDNPIVKRSPEAPPESVDLSAYYNASLDDDWFQHAGHDYQDLPKGIQVFGGVPFDVRGLIQLAASHTMDVTGVVFPEAVEGIEVRRTGQRLSFLQACFWHADEGAKLGEYVIHYVDGQTKSAPILYLRNTMDWWVRPGDALPTQAEQIWVGQNPSTRSFGFNTHLLKYTWENPLPEVEISTIDFCSDLIEAGPFLVALTVEPNESAPE
jgi:hypothetical protein